MYKILLLILIVLPNLSLAQVGPGGLTPRAGCQPYSTVPGCTGVAGTNPGGNPSDIQFNNSGIFGGTSNATLDSSGDSYTAGEADFGVGNIGLNSNASTQILPSGNIVVSNNVPSGTGWPQMLMNNQADWVAGFSITNGSGGVRWNIAKQQSAAYVGAASESLIINIDGVSLSPMIWYPDGTVAVNAANTYKPSAAFDISDGEYTFGDTSGSLFSVDSGGNLYTAGNSTLAGGQVLLDSNGENFWNGAIYVGSLSLPAPISIGDSSGTLAYIEQGGGTAMFDGGTITLGTNTGTNFYVDGSGNELANGNITTGGSFITQGLYIFGDTYGNLNFNYSSGNANFSNNIVAIGGASFGNGNATIDNTGKGYFTTLGVGTTSPSRTFGIDAGSNTYMSFMNSGTEQYVVGSEAGVRPWLIYDPSLGQYTMYADTTGNIGVQNNLNVNGTASLGGLLLPSGASSGYVLTSDSYGNGTWQLAAGGVPFDRITSTAGDGYGLMANYDGSLLQTIDVFVTGTGTGADNIGGVLGSVNGELYWAYNAGPSSWYLYYDPTTGNWVISQQLGVGVGSITGYFYAYSQLLGTYSPGNGAPGAATVTSVGFGVDVAGNVKATSYTLNYLGGGAITFQDGTTQTTSATSIWTGTTSTAGDTAVSNAYVPDNLFVGTTSPTNPYGANMDVENTLDSTVNFSVVNDSATSNAQASFIVGNDATHFFQGAITSSVYSGLSDTAYFNTNATGGLSLYVFAGGGPIALGVNNSRQFEINGSTGDVIVDPTATFTDNGQAFQVNGTIAGSAIQTNNPATGGNVGTPACIDANNQLCACGSCA